MLTFRALFDYLSWDTKVNLDHPLLCDLFSRLSSSLEQKLKAHHIFNAIRIAEKLGYELRLSIK